MNKINAQLSKEKAQEYFLKGYNCTQAVVLTFKDLVNLDEEHLLKIASSFGGGMGRLREVCGAVSGMLIICGLLYGYATPETGEIKANHYKNIQDLAKEFEKEFGSIVCRELLGINTKHDSPNPTPRTTEFYKKRPCATLIGEAAFILANFINNKI